MVQTGIYNYMYNYIYNYIYNYMYNYIYNYMYSVYHVLNYTGTKLLLNPEPYYSGPGVLQSLVIKDTYLLRTFACEPLSILAIIMPLVIKDTCY